MQAIEFLQGFGWACVAAYCLNNLGLVPTSWIDAAQSRMGIPHAETVSSPSASPYPSQSPSPSVQEGSASDSSKQ